jgi:uncharacterized protein YggE
MQRKQTSWRLFFFATLVLFLSSFGHAQFAGSRGGLVAGTSDHFSFLSTGEVKSHIAVEGKAELRLKPTGIRIVLAVTSEDETSRGCSEKIKTIAAQVKKNWLEIGVKEKEINEDFIAILPRYEWKIEEQNGQTTGIETKVGYRMQSNLHVAVVNEAKALNVLEKAYEAGVTDIIAFDYWSDELEKGKTSARKTAIEAAKKKADTLLAIFEEKPKVINVQEKTTTHFPSSLYHSFKNVYEGETYRPTRRDIPFIGAYRPKNTYYRGLQVETDVGSKELAMEREISIVSTVRIYFQPPVDDADSEKKDD